MSTIVLDDDPTGTQAVSGVQVLLDWDATSIVDAIRADGAVYLQTNSRAIPKREAIALATRIREDIAAAAAELGEQPLVVLRGDSTLRGHVFAESDVFIGDTGRILFVPAFPAGGRTTIGAVHRLRIGDEDIPVAETEFAQDPVFGYTYSNLLEWVREQGDRAAYGVPLVDLRATGGLAVAEALRNAGPGEVVAPDVETDADIELIHRGMLAAIDRGTDVIVRSGAPLAALAAGHMSRGLLAQPISVPGPDQTLVVCGSHTSASTAQIRQLLEATGLEVIEIPTDDAREDPEAAGAAAAQLARECLRARGITVITSERIRRVEHDSLADGELVMRALMTATRQLSAEVGVIVSKGGITSAEVAANGFGATRATVRGQIAAGISVWDLNVNGEPRVQVVVPGNVGAADTLVEVLAAIGGTRGGSHE
jgi:uncharacterized protein YgbK (DUF1537 family)